MFELVSCEYVECIDSIFGDVLVEVGLVFFDIDVVVVIVGFGLVGVLFVGLMYGKGFV